MLTRTEHHVRTRAFVGACLMGAALLAFAAPVRSQDMRADSRWQAWLGCWEQVGTGATGTEGSRPALICVLPVAGTTSAVEFATVVDREIVSRTRIDANGERHAVEEEGCGGWERAHWSADGRRLFLHSEVVCPGGDRRAVEGILAMNPRGEWLNVQGITIAGNQGMRVARYREARDRAALPTEKAAQTREANKMMVNTARLAAATPLTVAEVIEAARTLDAPTVEAWLLELGQNFGVDAGQLLALDQAQVPGRIIDLMVALSYPEVFEIEGGARAGDLRAASAVARREIEGPGGRAALQEAMARDRFGYAPHSSLYGFQYGYSPYTLDYGYGFGYRYGYDWNRPVVVIVRPSSNEQPQTPVQRQRHRVVNGRGYTQDDRRANFPEHPSNTERGCCSSRAGASPAGGASTPPSTSSGSGSNTSDRTAKPRSQGGTN